MVNRVSRLSAKQIFLITLVFTAIIKVWLAIYFPITGDEAFFYQWARFPDWGFYDHPPMIGWWLWLLKHLGDSPFVIRSATLTITSFVAIGVVYLARRLLPVTDEPKAWLAGAIYLSMPVSWVAIFVTTDTPLVFFMWLSILTYVLSIRKESVIGIFFAGVFLGLAFLSKYFAVLLGVAYGVHLLMHPKRFRYLFLLTIGALPFVIVNVFYNATHCWNNIMFNVVNRNEDAVLGWRNVLLFALMMVYLITPWCFGALVKRRSAWLSHKALSLVFVVPMLLFLVISLEKTIGLHWVLGFLPVAFVMLALCTPLHLLRRYVGFNVLFALPHLLLVAVLVHGNATIWPSKSFQQEVRFHRDLSYILDELTQGMPAGAVLTTMSYSPAALMSYHYKQTVPVFGPGKYHARNDDVFVDWREMAGKPIRIVSKAKPIDPAVYTAYLSNARISTQIIDDIPFYIVDGDHFNYQKFHDIVLREAVEKYYKIPKILPVLDCPFGRKYSFEKECRVGDMGTLF